MMEGPISSLMDREKMVVEAEVTDSDDAVRLLETSSWFSYLQKKTGRQLIFQLPEQLIPDLNRELVRLGIHVKSLQSKNSLESYFLSLTRNKQNVATFTN